MESTQKFVDTSILVAEVTKQSVQPTTFFEKCCEKCIAVPKQFDPDFKEISSNQCSWTAARFSLNCRELVRLYLEATETSPKQIWDAKPTGAAAQPGDVHQVAQLQHSERQVWTPYQIDATYHYHTYYISNRYQPAGTDMFQVPSVVSHLST
jgi:hypothetical protein